MKDLNGAAIDTTDYTAYTSGGTARNGFYEGSDGGGIIQYALLEQLFPITMDKVLALGDITADDPAIGVGDNHVQALTDIYMKPGKKIKFFTENFAGVASETPFEIWTDSTGKLFVGDTTGAYIRFGEDTGIQLLGAPVRYGSVVKSDGATTQDVSGHNIVSFNDTAATNFTGFTNAKQGQVIWCYFNSANTTFVHSATLKIPGGANQTYNANDGIQIIMRSDTIAQVIR